MAIFKLTFVKIEYKINNPTYTSDRLDDNKHTWNQGVFLCSDFQKKNKGRNKGLVECKE